MSSDIAQAFIPTNITYIDHLKKERVIKASLFKGETRNEQLTELIKLLDKLTSASMKYNFGNRLLNAEIKKEPLPESLILNEVILYFEAVALEKQGGKASLTFVIASPIRDVFFIPQVPLPKQRIKLFQLKADNPDLKALITILEQILVFKRYGIDGSISYVAGFKLIPQKSGYVR